MTNMTPADLEIATKLNEVDSEFRELWDEHQILKESLRRLTEKRYLTPEEEVEMKRLKHLKLVGKDKIAMKIAAYKVSTPG